VTATLPSSASLTAFLARFPAAQVQSICGCVIGTADHAIPPAELLAMAHQAHARITIIPGGPHLSMISNPGIVTWVILRAARATS
jgi:hypothetical protein